MAAEHQVEMAEIEHGGDRIGGDGGTGVAEGLCNAARQHLLDGQLGVVGGFEPKAAVELRHVGEGIHRIRQRKQRPFSIAQREQLRRFRFGRADYPLQVVGFPVEFGGGGVLVGGAAEGGGE